MIALRHTAKTVRHSRESANPAIPTMLFALSLITAAWQTNANATELGRLFYTPQERTQLNLGMLQTNTEATSADAPDYLTVNGMIQKKGGNRIVWVNGKQQKAGYSNENQPATVPVTLPGKTQPVQMKVGQRIKLDAPINAGGKTPPPATEASQ